VSGYRPAGGTPLTGLAPDFLDTALVWPYAAFALLYGLGLVAPWPRTGGHTAAVAAGGFASLLAAAHWPAVRRLPAPGPLLYFLPGLLVLTLPFALDFYLMFGR
jgi:hypothetical protein